MHGVFILFHLSIVGKTHFLSSILLHFCNFAPACCLNRPRPFAIRTGICRAGGCLLGGCRDFPPGSRKTLIKNAKSDQKSEVLRGWCEDRRRGWHVGARRIRTAREREQAASCPTDRLAPRVRVASAQRRGGKGTRLSRGDHINPGARPHGWTEARGEYRVGGAASPTYGKTVGVYGDLLNRRTDLPILTPILTRPVEVSRRSLRSRMLRGKRRARR